MREPLRQGFSMPSLKHADSVYKALDALKRESDSTPSLRCFEDDIIARHGNFKYQRIGREVILLPASHARNEGSFADREDKEDRKCFPRHDASAYGRPVERDIFSVSNTRNEGIAAEEADLKEEKIFACNEGPKRRNPVRRRFSSIFEMEDISPNESGVEEGFNGEREEVCEDGDHGRVTERGDSAVFDKRSTEKDRRQYKEPLPLPDHGNKQQFPGHISTPAVHIPPVVMPPSPSPLGVMPSQKRKPGKQKENAQAETRVRRVPRKRALPVAAPPRRQVLAAKNLNISTVEPAVGTPPRVHKRPALFTPPRPNLAGRTITPPRKVRHPHVPADPSFSSPIRPAPGGLASHTVTPERVNLGPFAFNISRPRAIRRASSSGFVSLCKSPTQCHQPVLGCSPVLPPLPALKIAPRPPLSFDDFNLHLILGQGGQGIVYLGTYKDSTPANRKPYAIKVISKASMDRVSLNFVLQEQHILHTLTKVPHPNVMCLDASFHDDKNFYLVNEAYPGGDLESFLVHNRRFNEATTCTYAAEMVLGIYHLHQLGIIHRDLKLQNIFIKADGHIVIGDMGLVRSFADEVFEDGTPKTLDYHFTTWGCGTLTHMAPEVFIQKIYSYEVDWWALGIMIYHMLLGQLPFTGDTNELITQAIVSQNPAFPPHGSPWGISPLAVSIILQLLVKDPSRRLKASEICSHLFFFGAPWPELQLQVFPGPCVPHSLDHAFETCLDPATLSCAGWNYFPDEDPHPCYNFINTELLAMLDERPRDERHHYDRDGSSTVLNPFRDPQLFGNEDMALYKPDTSGPGNTGESLEGGIVHQNASPQRSGTVGHTYELSGTDNHEANETTDNHEVNEVIGDNYDANDANDATDNHGANEPANYIEETIEALDDHDGTNGDAIGNAAGMIDGGSVPMDESHSPSHGMETPKEPSGWMDQLEVIQLEDGDVIFFIVQPPSEPEPAMPAVPLDPPREINRVHPGLKYFPSCGHLQSDWVRLPSDPPPRTRDVENYDKDLSDVVFYDGDTIFISNGLNTSEVQPVTTHFDDLNTLLAVQSSDPQQGTLDVSPSNSSEDSTVSACPPFVLLELGSLFSDSIWTTPPPSLGILWSSDSLDEVIFDLDSASSSAEEAHNSVRSSSSLIVPQSNGSHNFAISPHPSALFGLPELSISGFSYHYDKSVSDTHSYVDFDSVDLGSDVLVSISDVSDPQEDTAQPARPRRWIDRAFDFVTALARSIGGLRFSRSRRKCSSDSLV